MSRFRRYFLCLAIVTLMTTAAAQAQIIVSPVNPNPPPPINYDGRCAINFVDLAGGWAMVDYLCTGTFGGRVEADLSVQYTSFGYSQVSPAPGGFVSASYQAPNVPSYDALYTFSPPYPGYVSRAIATVRWEIPTSQCWQGPQWWNWTCANLWVTSGAQSEWH